MKCTFIVQKIKTERESAGSFLILSVLSQVFTDINDNLKIMLCAKVKGYVPYLYPQNYNCLY